MKTLFDLFKNAMLENPSASRRDALAAFTKAARGDAYFKQLAEDYFYRMAARFEPVQTKHGVTLEPTPMARKRAEVAASRKAESERLGEAAYKKTKAELSVVLLDLPLPDGTRLRQATGAKLAKCEGFFRAVGQALKPTQVVDRHLSEDDLKNIRARYFQHNDERAAS